MTLSAFLQPDFLDKTSLEIKTIYCSLTDVPMSIQEKREKILKNTEAKGKLTKIINGLDPNINIYRIEKIDRLIDSVVNNKISFTNPEKWKENDPWEEFIGKNIYIGDIKYSYPIKHRVQCWSTQAESDAMWRIYSQKKDEGSSYDSVKIKVNLKKYLDLVEIIDSESGFFTLDQIHDVLIAGHVKYLTRLEIEDNLKDPWFVAKLTSLGKFELFYDKTLFIKRNAFMHENEVRIVWTKKASKSVFQESDYSYLNNFNYKSIIEEIELDPRLQAGFECIQRDRLIKCGIKGNLIKKSSLYEPIGATPHTTKLLHEIASLSKVGLLDSSDRLIKGMIDNGNLKI